MANDSLTEENLNLAAILFSCTTVVAFFYTLIFTFYCFSFRLSYAQLRNDQGKINRKTVCTLVFQTILLICATSDVIVKNLMVRVRYIDNRALPGGPLGLQAVLSVTTLSKLDDAVSSVENILILGVLLWRVRVVWSGTYLVMPLTVVSLFLYLISAGLGISYYVIEWQIGFPSLPAIPRVQAILYITLTAFSLSSSVFMSVAIIVRLLSVRRKHLKVMGKYEGAGQYLGIVAMLIESYALDTVWGVGTVISFGMKYSPTAYLLDDCLVQVDIFSNFLLIYRVLSGRAWTRETQGRLSTLRWASNGMGTTTSRMADLQQTNMVEEDLPVICSRDNK